MVAQGLVISSSWEGCSLLATAGCGGQTKLARLARVCDATSDLIRMTYYAAAAHT